MSSLKDLARECGVSVATVSKALNGQSDISAATRDRVREAACRMGYVPNMAARAMKTNRTYNLGVLFVDERQSGLAHEYFSAVLDRFKVQVEKLGYDITFVNRNLGGSGAVRLRQRPPPHRLYPRRAHGGDGEPAGGLLQELRGAGAAGPRRICAQRCVSRSRPLCRGDPGPAGTAPAAHLHPLSR